MKVKKISSIITICLGGIVFYNFTPMGTQKNHNSPNLANNFKKLDEKLHHNSNYKSNLDETNIQEYDKSVNSWNKLIDNSPKNNFSKNFMNFKKNWFLSSDVGLINEGNLETQINHLNSKEANDKYFKGTLKSYSGAKNKIKILENIDLSSDKDLEINFSISYDIKKRYISTSYDVAEYLSSIKKDKDSSKERFHNIEKKIKLNSIIKNNLKKYGKYGLNVGRVQIEAFENNDGTIPIKYTMDIRAKRSSTNKNKYDFIGTINFNDNNFYKRTYHNILLSISKKNIDIPTNLVKRPIIIESNGSLIRENTELDNNSYNQYFSLINFDKKNMLINALGDDNRKLDIYISKINNDKTITSFFVMGLKKQEKIKIVIELKNNSNNIKWKSSGKREKIIFEINSFELQKYEPTKTNIINNLSFENISTNKRIISAKNIDEIIISDFNIKPKILIVDEKDTSNPEITDDQKKYALVTKGEDKNYELPLFSDLKISNYSSGIFTFNVNFYNDEINRYKTYSIDEFGSGIDKKNDSFLEKFKKYEIRNMRKKSTEIPFYKNFNLVEKALKSDWKKTFSKGIKINIDLDFLKNEGKVIPLSQFITFESGIKHKLSYKWVKTKTGNYNLKLIIDGLHRTNPKKDDYGRSDENPTYDNIGLVVNYDSQVIRSSKNKKIAFPKLNINDIFVYRDVNFLITQNKMLWYDEKSKKWKIIDWKWQWPTDLKFYKYDQNGIVTFYNQNRIYKFKISKNMNLSLLSNYYINSGSIVKFLSTKNSEFINVLVKNKSKTEILKLRFSLSNDFELISKSSIDLIINNEEKVKGNKFLNNLFYGMKNGQNAIYKYNSNLNKIEEIEIEKSLLKIMNDIKRIEYYKNDLLIFTSNRIYKYNEFTKKIHLSFVYDINNYKIFKFSPSKYYLINKLNNVISEYNLESNKINIVNNGQAFDSEIKAIINKSNSDHFYIITKSNTVYKSLDQKTIKTPFISYDLSFTDKKSISIYMKNYNKSEVNLTIFDENKNKLSYKELDVKSKLDKKIIINNIGKYNFLNFVFAKNKSDVQLDPTSPHSIKISTSIFTENKDKYKNITKYKFNGKINQIHKEGDTVFILSNDGKLHIYNMKNKYGTPLVEEEIINNEVIAPINKYNFFRIGNEVWITSDQNYFFKIKVENNKWHVSKINGKMDIILNGFIDSNVFFVTKDNKIYINDKNSNKFNILNIPIINHNSIRSIKYDYFKKLFILILEGGEVDTFDPINKIHRKIGNYDSFKKVNKIIVLKKYYLFFIKETQRIYMFSKNNHNYSDFSLLLKNNKFIKVESQLFKFLSSNDLFINNIAENLNGASLFYKNLSTQKIMEIIIRERDDSGKNSQFQYDLIQNKNLMKTKLDISKIDDKIQSEVFDSSDKSYIWSSQNNFYLENKLKFNHTIIFGNNEWSSMPLIYDALDSIISDKQKLLIKIEDYYNTRLIKISEIFKSIKVIQKVISRKLVILNSMVKEYIDSKKYKIDFVSEISSYLFDKYGGSIKSYVNLLLNYLKKLSFHKANIKISLKNISYLSGIGLKNKEDVLDKINKMKKEINYIWKKSDIVKKTAKEVIDNFKGGMIKLSLSMNAFVRASVLERTEKDFLVDKNNKVFENPASYFDKFVPTKFYAPDIKFIIDKDKKLAIKSTIQDLFGENKNIKNFWWYFNKLEKGNTSKSKLMQIIDKNIHFTYMGTSLKYVLTYNPNITKNISISRDNSISPNSFGYASPAHINEYGNAKNTFVAFIIHAKNGYKFRVKDINGNYKLVENVRIFKIVDSKSAKYSKNSNFYNNYYWGDNLIKIYKNIKFGSYKVGLNSKPEAKNLSVKNLTPFNNKDIKMSIANIKNKFNKIIPVIILRTGKINVRFPVNLDYLIKFNSKYETINKMWDYSDLPNKILFPFYFKSIYAKDVYSLGKSRKKTIDLNYNERPQELFDKLSYFNKYMIPFEKYVYPKMVDSYIDKLIPKWIVKQVLDENSNLNKVLNWATLADFGLGTTVGIGEIAFNTARAFLNKITSSIVKSTSTETVKYLSSIIGEEFSENINDNLSLKLIKKIENNISPIEVEIKSLPSVVNENPERELVVPVELFERNVNWETTQKGNFLRRMLFNQEINIEDPELLDEEAAIGGVDPNFDIPNNNLFSDIWDPSNPESMSGVSEILKKEMDQMQRVKLYGELLLNWAETGISNKEKINLFNEENPFLFTQEGRYIASPEDEEINFAAENIENHTPNLDLENLETELRNDGMLLNEEEINAIEALSTRVTNIISSRMRRSNLNNIDELFNSIQRDFNRLFNSVGGNLIRIFSQATENALTQAELKNVREFYEKFVKVFKSSLSHLLKSHNFSAGWNKIRNLDWYSGLFNNIFRRYFMSRSNIHQETDNLFSMISESLLRIVELHNNSADNAEFLRNISQMNEQLRGLGDPIGAWVNGIFEDQRAEIETVIENPNNFEAGSLSHEEVEYFKNINLSISRRPDADIFARKSNNYVKEYINSFLKNKEIQANYFENKFSIIRQRAANEIFSEMISANFRYLEYITTHFLNWALKNNISLEDEEFINEIADEALYNYSHIFGRLKDMDKMYKLSDEHLHVLLRKIFKSINQYMKNNNIVVSRMVTDSQVNSLYFRLRETVDEEISKYIYENYWTN